jgi:hypothetical protein
LTRLYREHSAQSLSTIGFGVMPAHRALLTSVDRAFVLSVSDQAPAAGLLQIPGVEQVAEPGAAGWSATITRLVGPHACAMSSN